MLHLNLSKKCISLKCPNYAFLKVPNESKSSRPQLQQSLKQKLFSVHGQPMKTIVQICNKPA